MNPSSSVESCRIEFGTLAILPINPVAKQHMARLCASAYQNECGEDPVGTCSACLRYVTYTYT